MQNVRNILLSLGAAIAGTKLVRVISDLGVDDAVLPLTGRQQVGVGEVSDDMTRGRVLAELHIATLPGCEGRGGRLAGWQRRSATSNPGAGGGTWSGSASP